MNFETYLSTVLESYLPNIKDEIKESLAKKILEYKDPKSQGEWIVVRKSAMFSSMLAVNCSRCGGEVDPMPCWKYVYCPMRGADMKKSDKE